MNANGRDVVIVEAVRTPIGRGHPEKGYYKDTHPNELLGKTYTEVIERAGIRAEAVEDVICGCVQQYGEQMFNVGRNAWLQAGLPIETPATTVDRQCGSAQQAVNFGAALIAAGVHDVVIGGGVEHMGHIPMGVGFKWVDDVGSPWPPALLEKYNLVPQGISAEMIADKWEIPRSEMDELALRSHQLAARATEEGRFERETVPFQVNGSTYVADQGIRPDTKLEALAGLKPAFKEDGKITAGNSSQISDGAAAVLLMSADKANELGVKPRARIVDQTTVGVDPVIMLDRPDPGDAQAARAQRDDDGRHRPRGDQRGVRAGRPRVEARARAGHGPRQRERRRDGARPPARVHRRAAPDHAAARARALRQGGRAGDDVLRRRPRHRDARPAGLNCARGVLFRGMSEQSTAYYREGAAPRAISTSQLLGQVMFLVAIALAFCAAGHADRA